MLTVLMEPHWGLENGKQLSGSPKSLQQVPVTGAQPGNLGWYQSQLLPSLDQMTLMDCPTMLTLSRADRALPGLENMERERREKRR